MHLSFLPFTFTALTLTTLVLIGCDNSPNKNILAISATATEAHNGEAIMLHALINYTSSYQQHELGQKVFVVSLEIQQPAFREGKGLTATYFQGSTKAQVLGFVRGTGNASITSGETQLVENYDKSARWTTLQTPAKGIFSVLPPEPSALGDGLNLKIKIHGIVSGTQSAKVIAPGESSDTDLLLALPLECNTHDPHFAEPSEACGMEFELDVTPTEAKTEAAEAQLTKLQQALAIPENQWSLAVKGQHYGATTTYSEDGHFVTRFNKTYTINDVESSLELTANIVVWSSKRGDNSTPEALPALKSL